MTHHISLRIRTPRSHGVNPGPLCKGFRTSDPQRSVLGLSTEINKYIHAYCMYTYVCPVQVVNHSVSNIEFEWTGMESMEAAHISVQPNAGSVGTYVCSKYTVYILYRKYIRTYIHMSVHTYVRMYVRMSVCIYVHTYICMYVCTYVRTYISQALCCSHSTPFVTP